MRLAQLLGDRCQPNEWLALCAAGLVAIMATAWRRHRRPQRATPRPGAGREIAFFICFATVMLVQILLQIRAQPGAWGTC